MEQESARSIIEKLVRIWKAKLSKKNNFHTFTLSLSHFHFHNFTFTLSLSHFHFHTFTLSHFHTFTLSLSIAHEEACRCQLIRSPSTSPVQQKLNLSLHCSHFISKCKVPEQSTGLMLNIRKVLNFYFDDHLLKGNI